MSNPFGSPDIPPSIKAKITQFKNAVEEAAFIGMQPPEDRDAIQESLDWSRYELEATIATILKRKEKKE